MTRTILCVGGSDAGSRERYAALHSAGFEILDAATEADALRLAAEQNPAVMVLPLNLPGIDGFALCKRMKGDSRISSIPVLHVSAEGGQSEYPASIESGADGYLCEPVPRKTLTATVAALIKAAAARKRIGPSLREPERI